MAEKWGAIHAANERCARRKATAIGWGWQLQPVVLAVVSRRRRTAFGAPPDPATGPALVPFTGVCGCSPTVLFACLLLLCCSSASLSKLPSRLSVSDARSTDARSPSPTATFSLPLPPLPSLARDLLLLAIFGPRAPPVEPSPPTRPGGSGGGVATTTGSPTRDMKSMRPQSPSGRKKLLGLSCVDPHKIHFTAVERIRPRMD